MRAAAVQLESNASHAANLASAEDGVRAAAKDGAKLVVLPEKWPLLTDDDATREGAELLDGPSMSMASDLAEELKIDLVAGSFAEQVAGTDLLANTSIHFGPDGAAKAVYRKIHLFDASVGGRDYLESAAFAPGDQPVLSETADGTILGMAICFDIRFPELFSNLAGAGAEVFVLPAAFTKVTTDAHWEVLLRARAIENGCHIVAANQNGSDGIGRPSGGNSVIVSPWGKVLDRAPHGYSMALAELEAEDRAAAREALPMSDLRRNAASFEPMRGNG
ncbi:MAG: carbon-nitrogen hydrolase family protein [Actinomycetes bacterium]